MKLTLRIFKSLIRLSVFSCLLLHGIIADAANERSERDSEAIKILPSTHPEAYLSQTLLIFFVDTDGDGNDDTTDPNPNEAVAEDDTNSGAPETAIITDVLLNDDFLANSNPDNQGTTEITDLGTGTGSGTVSINNNTGEITYVPLASENNTTVTINYQVCNTDTGVCATAILSINVAAADTDGDGNPDDSDPNPNAGVAEDDTGNATPNVVSPIDILVNDDFLANSNPNNVGTTAITDEGGGTAAGDIQFENDTGELLYTPTAAEENTTVTVIYRVTNTDTGVFDTATVTIMVGENDTDGDGNPNSSDDNPNSPEAENDFVVVEPLVSTSVDILVNDDFLSNNNDQNVGNTEITAIGGTAAGDIVFDNDTGELIYEALLVEDNSTVTVIYQVCNTLTNVCGSATVFIEVGEPDADFDGNPDGTDPNPNSPTAVDDIVDALPLITTAVDVLVNDDYLANSNPNNQGDTVITDLGTGNAQGTVVILNDIGEILYTPTLDEQNTEVTIDYQVCNVAVDPAVCATATIIFNVGPADQDQDGNPDDTDPNPNDPTANDDTLTVEVGETGSVNILANDDFLDNQDPNNVGTTQITIINDGGTSGTITVDAETGIFTYEPVDGEENQTYEVQYEVCNTDPDPDVCATATIFISVIPQDTDGDGNPDDTDPNPDTPIAQDDTMDIDPNETETINILANDDYLPNNDSNNVGTTEITDLGTGTAGGAISFNNDTGEFTYTALESESGSTVTVDYEVCNIETNVCAVATIFINVGVLDTDEDGNPDDNDPNPFVPTANDDTFDIDAGDTETFNILDNDDYLDNEDPVNLGTTQITDLGTGTAGGTVTFNNDTGEITYTALASEEGQTVTVNYQVCNVDPDPDVCATATVFFNVTDPDDDDDGNPDDNDPNPTEAVAQDDTFDIDPGETGTFNILDNDDFLDNEDPLNLGTTQITNVGTGTAGGDVTFNNDTGEVTYTALESEAGQTVTVDYQVCNVDPDPDVCATATIFFNVDDPDDDGDGNDDDDDPNPDDAVAQDDEMEVEPNVPETIDILDNDDFLGNDDEDNLGTTEITDLGTGTAQGSISFDNDSGEFTYTALESEAGQTVTVDYQVCNTDEDPDVCATATIFITVVDPDAFEVKVFNVVTPNGDGENDFLLIENLENFATSSVKIYNRWGVLVYDANGYNNSSVRFDGVSDGRATLNDGDQLPVGTYFYLVSYSGTDNNGNNLSDQLSGYLYINR